MYDGDQWNDLKPMSITRDRPACSIAQFDDGSVSIDDYLLESFQDFWINLQMKP